ncbi:hypothetical protein PROFUN_12810 [Planoprotostelium fungivorum]|uniref:Uncharacterized protein n=1 Tax=Planoprotostelium fungivorum TaxID=1890364 RepID=A0A2P6N6Q1_9EUKA|nr:hypothetical protein PROFUN_12810 [Planoprotostelium fungivorum]
MSEKKTKSTVFCRYYVKQDEEQTKKGEKLPDFLRLYHQQGRTNTSSKKDFRLFQFSDRRQDGFTAAERREWHGNRKKLVEHQYRKYRHTLSYINVMMITNGGLGDYWYKTGSRRTRSNAQDDSERPSKKRRIEDEDVIQAPQPPRSDGKHIGQSKLVDLMDLMRFSGQVLQRLTKNTTITDDTAIMRVEEAVEDSDIGEDAMDEERRAPTEPMDDVIPPLCNVEMDGPSSDTHEIPTVTKTVIKEEDRDFVIPSAVHESTPSSEAEESQHTPTGEQDLPSYDPSHSDLDANSKRISGLGAGLDGDYWQIKAGAGRTRRHIIPVEIFRAFEMMSQNSEDEEDFREEMEDGEDVTSEDEEDGEREDPSQSPLRTIRLREIDDDDRSRDPGRAAVRRPRLDEAMEVGGRRPKSRSRRPNPSRTPRRTIEQITQSLRESRVTRPPSRQTILRAQEKEEGEASEDQYDTSWKELEPSRVSVFPHVISLSKPKYDIRPSFLNKQRTHHSPLDSIDTCHLLDDWLKAFERVKGEESAPSTTQFNALLEESFDILDEEGLVNVDFMSRVRNVIMTADPLVSYLSPSRDILSLTFHLSFLLYSIGWIYNATVRFDSRNGTEEDPLLQSQRENDMSFRLTDVAPQIMKDIIYLFADFPACMIPNQMSMETYRCCMLLWRRLEHYLSSSNFNFWSIYNEQMSSFRGLPGSKQDHNKLKNEEAEEFDWQVLFHVLPIFYFDIEGRATDSPVFPPNWSLADKYLRRTVLFCDSNVMEEKLERLEPLFQIKPSHTLQFTDGKTLALENYSREMMKRYCILSSIWSAYTENSTNSPLHLTISIMHHFFRGKLYLSKIFRGYRNASDTILQFPALFRPWRGLSVPVVEEADDCFQFFLKAFMYQLCCLPTPQRSQFWIAYRKRCPPVRVTETSVGAGKTMEQLVGSVPNLRNHLSVVLLFGACGVASKTFTNALLDYAIKPVLSETSGLVVDALLQFSILWRESNTQFIFEKIEYYLSTFVKEFSSNYTEYIRSKNDLQRLREGESVVCQNVNVEQRRLIREKDLVAIVMRTVEKHEVQVYRLQSIIECILLRLERYLRSDDVAAGTFALINNSFAEMIDTKANFPRSLVQKITDLIIRIIKCTPVPEITQLGDSELEISTNYMALADALSTHVDNHLSVLIRFNDLSQLLLNSVVECLSYVTKWEELDRYGAVWLVKEGPQHRIPFLFLRYIIRIYPDIIQERIPQTLSLWFLSLLDWEYKSHHLTLDITKVPCIYNTGLFDRISPDLSAQKTGILFLLSLRKNGSEETISHFLDCTSSLSTFILSCLRQNDKVEYRRKVDTILAQLCRIFPAQLIKTRHHNTITQTQNSMYQHMVEELFINPIERASSRNRGESLAYLSQVGQLSEIFHSFSRAWGEPTVVKMAQRLIVASIHSVQLHDRAKAEFSLDNLAGALFRKEVDLPLQSMRRQLITFCFNKFPLPETTSLYKCSCLSLLTKLVARGGSNSRAEYGMTSHRIFEEYLGRDKVMVRPHIYRYFASVMKNIPVKDSVMREQMDVLSSLLTADCILELISPLYLPPGATMTPYAILNTRHHLTRNRECHTLERQLMDVVQLEHTKLMSLSPHKPTVQTKPTFRSTVNNQYKPDPMSAASEFLMVVVYSEWRDRLEGWMKLLQEAVVTNTFKSTRAKEVQELWRKLTSILMQ